MNKILTTVLTGLTMMAALTGCATGADAEQQFLTSVRATLDTGFSDSELIGVARGACDAVAAGGGQQALQQLILGSGLSPYDYGLVVGHGVTHLCPEQGDAFDAIQGR